MNALAMLTRGYVCPVQGPDGEVVIGPGPEIVDVETIAPTIVGGKVTPPPHVCPTEDD